MGELVRLLFSVVDELESLFPSRRFTPDGHLVGSLGEAIAAYIYGLELLPASTKTHDARQPGPGGRLVQVKLTTGDKGFSIYDKPEHLIALRLIRRVSIVEVFNGPGALAWTCAGKEQKNGQRSLPLRKLEELNGKVDTSGRIPSVAAIYFS
ncbi:MAG: hypothetical protein KIT20_04460 [Alphaproteobacteria bacterium]|nr:hypothetical protein [Alphaproteobacteria bacterium]